MTEKIWAPMGAESTGHWLLDDEGMELARSSGVIEHGIPSIWAWDVRGSAEPTFQRRALSPAARRAAPAFH